MSLEPALFSSAVDRWETPPEVFAWAEQRFAPFDLDAAASPTNHLCPRFFSAERSAFEESWAGASVWLNPPYGRALPAWAERAVEQAPGCRGISVLVPARTDAQWWATLWGAASEVVFFSGRLRFRLDGRPGDSAPFPSALLRLPTGPVPAERGWPRCVLARASSLGQLGLFE